MTKGGLSGQATRMVTEVFRLTELGIAVVPGTRIVNDFCSCGSTICRSPGMHPADSGWLFHATTDPVAVTNWWNRWPSANIVVPLLGRFHILDVPPEIGLLVNQWLGETPEPTGPISVTDECRVHFWTRPGTALKLQVLLNRRARSLDYLDIRVHREGSYILAPPSQGPLVNYSWWKPPSEHIRNLPDPAPLLELFCDACFLNGRFVVS